jgi:hypothetical protein
MKDAQHWIDALALRRHPEGGYFRETYRATFAVTTPSGQRAASTAIYFLLSAGEISKLHRIRSDEVWHHYDGGTLMIQALEPGGQHVSMTLSGDGPQAVVPAGWWFGATVVAGDFVLAGCTVAPGFDFADFEMANCETLIARYPQHRALIERLTDASPPV